LAGDLGGGLPAQFRVRPDVIIIVPPGHEHEAGMRQRREQGLVNAFVTQAAVEALDEAVLHRLPRRDIMPFDLTLLRPAQDRRRGQFGPVVADDYMKLSSQADQRRQFPGNADSGQRCIDHQRQALARQKIP